MLNVITESQERHTLFSATYMLCSKKCEKSERRFPNQKIGGKTVNVKLLEKCRHKLNIPASKFNVDLIASSRNCLYSTAQYKKCIQNHLLVLGLAYQNDVPRIACGLIKYILSLKVNL
jgi:hypothetical protein